MSKLALDMYRQMITRLKRGNTKGVFSNAKPIFIITLIDFIPCLRENKLKWADKLFEILYLVNFAKYNSNKPTPLWKPFFYLDSEQFYSLCWNKQPSTQQMKRPSGKFLREFVAYAKLDDDLWNLLQDEKNREYLKNCIIEQYLKIG